MNDHTGHETTGQVGPDHQVTITLPTGNATGVMHVTCEWEPDVPSWEYLQRYLADYHAIRGRAITAWSERTGKRVLVVDT